MWITYSAKTCVFIIICVYTWVTYMVKTNIFIIICVYRWIIFGENEHIYYHLCMYVCMYVCGSHIRRKRAYLSTFVYVCGSHIGRKRVHLSSFVYICGSHIRRKRMVTLRWRVSWHDDFIWESPKNRNREISDNVCVATLFGRHRSLTYNNGGTYLDTTILNIICVYTIQCSSHNAWSRENFPYISSLLCIIWHQFCIVCWDDLCDNTNLLWMNDLDTIHS